MTKRICVTGASGRAGRVTVAELLAHGYEVAATDQVKPPHDIGANVLQTGDRVEIHFDLAHQGAATGFEFKALWGQTVLMDRVGVAAESMIAGKGEAGVYNGGAQLRAESWGTTLAFAAGMVNATDSMVPALTINFWVKMEQSTSETVTLRNFTVVRYPAQ